MLTSSNLRHASGSEGKHWGKNRISLPAATYKMEPVFVSQKISAEEDPGRKKRSGVLLTYLFGKNNLHQPLHKWHRRQSCEGYKIQNELLVDMG